MSAQSQFFFFFVGQQIAFFLTPTDDASFSHIIGSQQRVLTCKLADRYGAETMEQKMCPKRQSPPIFYNVKTSESVTEKVITLVMLL